MNKVVAIIPARSDSSRLPNKHLRLACGKPMIQYLIMRLQSLTAVDEVVVATTDRACDDELVLAVKQLGAKVYRGCLDDVLRRIREAADYYEATVVVKANGDNPLQAPEVIDLGIKQLLAKKLDLVTGKNKYTGLPIGLGAEILSIAGLHYLDEYVPAELREHVTLAVFERQTELNWLPIEVPASWQLPGASITVDTLDEFNQFAGIVNQLKKLASPQWSIESVLSIMKEGEVCE